MSDGIFSPHTKNPKKQEWLTPPEIISSLGEFDLDPCSPVDRPWPTATLHYTILDNGLKQDWKGRVFCNPLYNNVDAWLEKCMMHGNAIAMVYARTDTVAWVRYIWKQADAVMFLFKRINFYHVTGERSSHNCGAPCALVAYGDNNVQALRESALAGKVVYLK